MLIFLDFDGATHPYGCPSKMLFCELPRIVRLLREPAYSHVDIVVSSSWRLSEPFEDGVFTFAVLPLDQIRQHFPHEVQHQIIGATPWLGELTDGIREREIRQWLADSDRPDRDWIALDDFEHLFEPNCPNLIPVECATGLDDDVEGKLRRRLLDR